LSRRPIETQIARLEPAGLANCRALLFRGRVPQLGADPVGQDLDLGHDLGMLLDDVAGLPGIFFDIKQG
jgi:hypothetical protein